MAAATPSEQLILDTYHQVLRENADYVPGSIAAVRDTAQRLGLEYERVQDVLRVHIG